MSEAVHVGTIHVSERGRIGLDEARNFAREQSAGQVAPSGEPWAERVLRERWAVDVVYSDGEIETLEFDGALRWPLSQNT